MGVEFNPTITSGTTATAQHVFENSQLDSMDFLQLMIQELVNQDPMEPMKNEDLLNQVSQIKNMETLTQLDKTLSGMTTQQKVATAGALIGKEVSGISSGLENVTGVVVKVTVSTTDGVTLVTDAGDKIGIDDVIEIREVSKK